MKIQYPFLFYYKEAYCFTWFRNVLKEYNYVTLPFGMS